MTRALGGGKKMPLELIEYRLCEKFGWTPDQLDSQDATTIKRFLDIIRLEQQLAEAESKSPNGQRR